MTEDLYYDYIQEPLSSGVDEFYDMVVAKGADFPEAVEGYEPRTIALLESACIGGISMRVVMSHMPVEMSATRRSSGRPGVAT